MFIAMAAALLQFLTGDQLLARCAGGEGGKVDGVCVGYIVGIVDAHAAAVQMLGETPLFCVPNGATDEQLQAAVVGFLTRRSDLRGGSAAAAVDLALGEAYPCAAATPAPPSPPPPPGA